MKPIQTGTDSDGNPEYDTEECDLGSYNTDGDPDNHACTTSCKVSDKSKWKCTWAEDSAGSDNYVSTCEWLCGNKKVDR